MTRSRTAESAYLRSATACEGSSRWIRSTLSSSAVVPGSSLVMPAATRLHTCYAPVTSPRRAEFRPHFAMTLDSTSKPGIRPNRGSRVEADRLCADFEPARARSARFMLNVYTQSTKRRERLSGAHRQATTGQSNGRVTRPSRQPQTTVLVLLKRHQLALGSLLLPMARTTGNQEPCGRQARFDSCMSGVAEGGGAVEVGLAPRPETARGRAQPSRGTSQSPRRFAGAGCPLLLRARVGTASSLR
jgi:hypothetical protein